MTHETNDTEVRVSVMVAAPIERAFQVFTERGDDWWPRSYGMGESERSDLILEPRKGGRWYERAPDGQECDWGRVLEWDPPYHLVLSWQIGVGFVPEPNPERVSRVDVTFVEEEPGRTVVDLVHSQLERHGEGWESMRDSVAGEGGWPGLFKAYRGLFTS